MYSRTAFCVFFENGIYHVLHLQTCFELLLNNLTLRLCSLPPQQQMYTNIKKLYISSSQNNGNPTSVQMKYSLHYLADLL